MFRFWICGTLDRAARDGEESWPTNHSIGIPGRCSYMSHARLAFFALLTLAIPLCAQSWGTTAFHHADGVLAVDARGDVIASGGKDAVLRLWKPDGSDAWVSDPD